MSNQVQLLIGQTTGNAPFALPADAATQKIAFLGRSGSGKTYAATKLAELLHEAGVQIVVLDPVGVWYGLRLAANGKGAGLAIPIFGGEHGDIPLEPGAGALVADLVVERGISLILDVSHFRKAQRKEFVTAFAEQLFHRKKTARSPMHFFLEEAQFFIPQKTFKGEERMLGAFEDIGKVGRNYGIGLTLISQRPQAVNKDVLNQVEALFVLQMNAAQERKAIRDWIDAQGINAGAAVDELPRLEIGQAYVWSPQWLKFFGKIKIGRKLTYNASATPTLNDATAAAPPRPLERAELDSLHQAMQEVVKQVEAHDPAALRRRIAALEKELNGRKSDEAASKSQITVERVEVPVLKDEQVRQLQQAIERLVENGKQLVTIGQDLAKALAAATARPVPVQARSIPEARHTPRQTQPVPHGADADTPKLRAGERRMLETLARRFPLRLTRTQLGALAGFTPSGGTFGAYFATLKRAGLLEETSGEVVITQAGLDYLGHLAPPPPQTTEEIIAMWREALRAGERRMLDELVAVYPAWLSREELGARTGFTVSGGTFGAYLGTLRRNGLVEVAGNQVRAGAVLFLSD
ncbi:MAG: DUF87 domain-containing protein [Anaerolineae bacterium]|nr:DUF87 domain-containing protein [Anaerolineae bacterium]